MSDFYTVEDYREQENASIYKLKSDILQGFFNTYIEPYIYLYELEDNKNIKLIFSTDQFCHLLGLQYFGYSGLVGWNRLLKNPTNIADLQKISSKIREKIRIERFNRIIHILDNPNIYIYKNTDLSYSSIYFAVYEDDVRYYKLGIGLESNGNYFPETYQVSLKTANDNKEIVAENLVKIIKKNKELK